MYKHILIATDGSELAGKGVETGLALAKQLGAAVTIVTVTETLSAADIASTPWAVGHSAIEEYETAVAEAAKKILDAAAAAAKEKGIAAELIHVSNNYPAQGIIDTASGKGCDLLVMASHGRRGLGRLLLGSQTTEVLTHSRVPVLVVR